jgi:hypothetical protein
MFDSFHCGAGVIQIPSGEYVKEGATGVNKETSFVVFSVFVEESEDKSRVVNELVGA